MGSEFSAMGLFFWAMFIISTCGFQISADSVLQDGTVFVDGKAASAEIEDDFVCATLDWWPPEKCDYGRCSWEQSSLLNLDLSNELLLKAVTAFTPLKLRLGGSLQDKLIYGTEDLKQPCNPFVANMSEMFGFTEGCLPMKRWDELNAFFQKSGVKVVFGLNALYGREIHPDNFSLGNWDSSNAESFMRYTLEKNYTIHGWELGNELCSAGVGTKIAADQYAIDTRALHDVVQQVYKDVEPKPQVIAPGGFFDAVWFNEYFMKTTPILDVTTRHIYNLGPGVDDHLVEKILDPIYLDEEANYFRDIKNVAKSTNARTVQWVGEAGGAFNSGRDGVSNTFVFGFWYLDQMGMAASFDNKAYCRQSLIGGNYGFLNTTNFTPNPDYYNALLWHRLMGRKVLWTRFAGTNKVRAYAHCAKQSTGVTLLLMNLDNSTGNQANIKFTGTITQEQSLTRASKNLVETGTREEYHLTPENGVLNSRTTLLNGKPLIIDSSGELPRLEPMVVRDSGPITLAPLSIAFVHLPDAGVAACA